LRVLVDTPVWADFLNGHPSPQARALSLLLEGDEDICTCGVVASEVFQGLTQDESRGALEELFRELTFIDPRGIDPYFKAAELYRLLRKRGITVSSTIDCLIAVLANEKGCYLLAKDKDLRRIVESGILRVSLWPA
jgi:predicted nucleic acid-binding protein